MSIRSFSNELSKQRLLLPIFFMCSFKGWSKQWVPFTSEERKTADVNEQSQLPWDLHDLGGLGGGGGGGGGNVTPRSRPEVLLEDGRSDDSYIVHE